jgi:hypothetical protein
VVSTISKLSTRLTTFPSSPELESEWKQVKKRREGHDFRFFKLRSTALGAVSGETEHTVGFLSSIRI